MSLKAHGRIRLSLEDKWYIAFIAEAWQPKLCTLSRDGILGALLGGTLTPTPTPLVY